MPKFKLDVNKIPLPTNKLINRKQEFPSTPRLYLELIENKDKIKQNLVDLEYIKSPGNSSDGEVDVDVDDTSSVEYKSRTPAFKKPYDDYDDKSDYDKSDYDKSYYDKSDYDKSDYDKSDYDRSRDDLSVPSSPKSELSNQSDLSNRLKNLLQEDQSDNESDNLSYNNFTAKRSGTNYFKKGSPAHIPTLAELEEKGHIHQRDHLPELDRFQNNQDEEDLKREMLFKFELLKKSYKESDIPDFTIHSDYKTMERSYENSVRRLSLDSNVEGYKTYMIYGFMGAEFVLGTWFKFDMQGFTQHQLTNMDSYERLLIELGEKSYVPGGSDWPVEVRLLGLILVNAAFFLISKLLMKKTGSNVLGMMNSMSNLKTDIKKPKRHMKGPDLDDLDLEE